MYMNINMQMSKQQHIYMQELVTHRTCILVWTVIFVARMIYIDVEIIIFLILQGGGVMSVLDGISISTLNVK